MPAPRARAVSGTLSHDRRGRPGTSLLQPGAVHPGGLALFPPPDRLRDGSADVYTAVLALGTVGALAEGLVLALREQVAQAWGTNAAGRTLVAPPSFSRPDGAAAAVLVFGTGAKVHR